ncbi:hypothetical protein HF670_11095 [Acidithiobacillus thiooxidans]|uniref:YqaJ viral recombinase family nuclease n=1 Tax=Acidithiobacillus thiooxidans TaxID=930 RepID=UPI001C06E46E|nr:YqaJ viral recombinase family protein [Acidithiobacillus thiooxidans]MBU2840094.1 hypothetical protein [Acidithiobacillus thiooxidans]
MKIVQLEQNTSEWLNWRKGGLGGSDAPIIMAMSPFKDPYTLYMEKTGAAKPATPHPAAAKAMQRGHDLEPVARDLVCKMAGEFFSPLCGEHEDHPWMRLSADGISMDGSTLLEIKCPGQKDWEKALDGEVPEKYVGQLQHAMYVSGAESLLYATYRPEEAELPIILPVLPDKAFQERLFQREAAFWKSVCDEDWSIFEGVVSDSLPDGFAELAADWLDFQEMAKSMEVNEKRLREALLSFLPEAGESLIKGAGLEVSRKSVKGSIDYTKLFKEMGIPSSIVDTYRKADTLRETVRKV